MELNGFLNGLILKDELGVHKNEVLIKIFGTMEDEILKVSLRVYGQLNMCLASYRYEERCG